MKKNKPTILALSGSAATREYFREHLVDDDVNVLIRQSRERGFHILEISEISLLIIDHELEDENGFDMVKEIREGDFYFNNVPIYAFGRQDFKEEDCIKLFDYGADDFSTNVPAPAIFKARVSKLLRWYIQQKNNPVKLATKLDSKEVPGIFQLLEAEKSTGVLAASHLKEKAQAIFREGKIIDAHTQYCKGKDAITEILAWPFVQIKFTEDLITPGNVAEPLDINVSSALMDCVLDVDIYRDVCKRLNDSEMSFTGGSQHLPKNSNRVAKQVVTLANTGLSLQEICETVRVNQRHLILMIDQMVKADYLKIMEPPFNRYIRDSHATLSRQHPNNYVLIEKCKQQMQQLKMPLAQKLSAISYASSALALEHGPAIVLAGDDPEVCKTIFTTIATVAANTSQVHSQVKSERKGDFRTKLIFDDNLSIDLILSSSKLDHHYLSKIREEYHDIGAVIYAVTSLDTPSNHNNRRNLRKLREQFRTPFTVALISDGDEEDPAFVFDCHNCTHKLKVEMSLQDSIGSCPICSTEIKTPDCLSYAQEHLKINELVPVVTLPSNSGELWRDLFDMILDDIKTTYQYGNAT